MKWIKASERLPKDDAKELNAKYDNELCFIQRFNHNAAIWHINDEFWIYEHDFDRLKWLDESEPPTPEVGKTKPFIVANVRELTDRYNDEEITFSRMVEMLNEIAKKYYTPVGHDVAEYYKDEPTPEVGIREILKNGSSSRKTD